MTASDVNIWVAIAVIIGGGLAAGFAAFQQARKPREVGDDAHDFGPKPHVIDLSPEARRFVSDAIERGVRAVSDHSETLIDHRRAVEDQTAELRRQRSET